MSKYVIDGSTLTSIGNAIREKTGGTESIPVTDLATSIASIEAGKEIKIERITFTGMSNHILKMGNDFINIFDYINSIDDIISLSVRIDTDYTNYVNHMEYFKGLGTVRRNFTSGKLPGTFLRCLSTKTTNAALEKDVTADSSSYGLGILDDGRIIYGMYPYSSDFYTQGNYSTTVSMFYLVLVYQV